MTIRVAARIARRELRGGLRGFRVFLACLALGVAAIAAIGSVREGIESALAREGATLLGGDASIELTYRFADETERAWMESVSTRTSEIVDFRSMAVVGEGPDADRTLTEVKAVDDAYPLLGAIVLADGSDFNAAMAGAGGVPGAVMDRLLAERLSLATGDRFRLGETDFVLMGIIAREPDNAGAFALAPRTIVRTAALEDSGLLQPGTLFDTHYRMVLPPATNLDAIRSEAREQIDGAMRWRDRRNGAGGTRRFLERLSTFLVLVGLAGLIVGGVGVSAAVKAYLDEKIPTIATLKSVGAEGRLIFQIYLLQIGALALLGICIGLVMGAVVPLLFAPVLRASLPVPPDIGLHLSALAEAATYGALTAAIFALWPIARTERIGAATLFRDAALGLNGWPAKRYVVLVGFLGAGLIGLAVVFTGERRLVLWAAGGLFAAFAMLVLAGEALRIVARRVARVGLLRSRAMVRNVLTAVGGPGTEAATVVVSLGLGLSVLAAIGQIDRNLKAAISQELPEAAPSFFFVDIQADQVQGYLDRLENDPAVTRIETAPMLRGLITEINGLSAIEAVGRHWVLSGDRGITYSAEPPTNAEVTEGEWWPIDYTGPPQISFGAEEAAEMGLKLGDTMTVNVLGRNITGTITSFRNVDFSNAGMGFVLSMNPSALAGAPHSYISTVYAGLAAEGAILRDIASRYPNVTAIGVRDAIGRVTAVLGAVAGAITYGALASLLTGGIVLIGAGAASERARRYEAAILKTLGATRAQVLINFALRSVLFGLTAGSVAVLAGAVAGYAVIEQLMELDFRFFVGSATSIVLVGICLTVLASLGFSLRALSARPASVLRARE